MKKFDTWQPQFTKVTALPSLLFGWGEQHARYLGWQTEYWFDGKQLLPVWQILDRHRGDYCPCLMFDGVIPHIEDYLQFDKWNLVPYDFDIKNDESVIVLGSDTPNTKMNKNLRRQWAKYQNQQLRFQRSENLPDHFALSWGHFVKAWQPRFNWMTLPSIPLEYQVQQWMRESGTLFCLSMVIEGSVEVYGQFHINEMRKELYWMQTFRNTENFIVNNLNLGNMVLAEALAYCHHNGWVLNLGNSDFEHKNHWAHIKCPTYGIYPSGRSPSKLLGLRSPN